MKIQESQIFNSIIKINKDITCYGNQYWIQLIDTENEDHSFLSNFVEGIGHGKEEYEATIILRKKNAK